MQIQNYFFWYFVNANSELFLLVFCKCKFRTISFGTLQMQIQNYSFWYFVYVNLKQFIFDIFLHWHE